MKRIIKRIRNTAAALVCCAAVVISGIPPFAPVKSFADTQADLAKQIADADATIKELEQKIASAGSDIEASTEMQDNYWNKLVATQNKIDLVNLSVANKNDEIAAKEVEIADKDQEIINKEIEIAETERKIADTEDQIAMLERKNEENIERFGEICCAMYMGETTNYLYVLAGAEDFFDIFVRAEVQKNVNEQYTRFVDDLRNDIAKLGQVKEDLKDTKVQQEKDKEQLKLDRISLEQEKDDLEDDRRELDEQIKYYNDLNSGYWVEYNTYSQQIKDLETRQANLQYQKKLTQADRDKAQAALEEEIRQAELRAKRNTVYDTGEWQWPLDLHFHLITTYFGYDSWRGGNHGGIDIGNSGIMGANVYASKGGEVLVAKTTYIPGYDYGMYVVIDHGNGYQTLYAHLSAIYVSVGQNVSKGDCIAAVGSTGWSTGPHLHFEVRQNGSRIDPFSVVTLPNY